MTQIPPSAASIMFDATRNMYRLIAVDPSCKHVIVNSTIVPDLEFHKTSERFGHWTDQATGTVYGIGFKTSKQLEDFQDCIEKAKSSFASGGDSREVMTGLPPIPTGARTSKIRAVPALMMEEDGVTPSISSLSTNTQADMMASLLLHTPSTHFPSSAGALQEENSNLKGILSRNLNNYKVWEAQLTGLREENEKLGARLSSLQSQVKGRKEATSEVEKEVELLKDHYLLLSHENPLEAELRALQREQAELLEEKEAMSGGLEGALHKARGALSLALQRNMEGKEAVMEVDNAFCRVIHTLTGIHGEIREAFNVSHGKQQRPNSAR